MNQGTFNTLTHSFWTRKNQPWMWYIRNFKCISIFFLNTVHTSFIATDTSVYYGSSWNVIIEHQKKLFAIFKT